MYFIVYMTAASNVKVIPTEKGDEMSLNITEISLNITELWKIISVKFQRNFSETSMMIFRMARPTEKVDEMSLKLYIQSL